MDPLSIDRLQELLRAAGHVRVLVVGDLMLDRYVTGTVERISPEAPVPVVRVDAESSAVGGAANVAANVVALGAACEVIGCVGDDLYGRLLREELNELGVATDGVVAAGDRPTTVKTRVLARHQQVVRFDHEVEGDVSPALAEALARSVQDRGEGCDALALEDYNKGVLVPAVVDAALGAALEAGRPSVVDPKRLRFFGFPGVTVFKPNAKELTDALGEPLRPDDPEWMGEVRRRLGCENLLLTLGEHGMALQTAGEDHLRIPTVARAVYDVSGAGDTVTATIAVILAAGGSPREAAVVANHAAALEVAKSGVATVSPEEILDQYRDFRGDGAALPDRPHRTIPAREERRDA